MYIGNHAPASQSLVRTLTAKHCNLHSLRGNRVHFVYDPEATLSCPSRFDGRGWRDSVYAWR